MNLDEAFACDEKHCNPAPEEQGSWRFDVHIAALRRQSSERARQLRAELPSRLADLLVDAPGATMSTMLMVDAEGLIDARVSVTGKQITEIGAAISELMRGVGEIDCSPVPSIKIPDDRSLREYPIVPADNHGRLGFALDGSCPPPMEWQPTSVLDAASLAAELSGLASTGIRVELRPVIGDGARFKVRLSALTGDDTPPILLRAMVRRLFPGLVIAADANARHTWLTVPTGTLAGVAVIPVGGSDPTPGFFTAAAAPIPVGPSRPSASGATIRIGHALNMIGRQLSVEVSESERLRHLEVTGQTGTGKSSTIAGMVYEVAVAGEGAIVLDPHGTLIDRIVAEAPISAADRLWVIRCGDVANPVPISPLAETDLVRQDIAIADTCAIFQELFDKKGIGIVGPRFQERVAMGMRAARALYGQTASILDVPMILGDDLVMAEAVARSNDGRLSAWFTNDKSARRSSDYGELVSWVNSKFEAFCGTAALRGILGSGCDAIDFATAMDRRRIILVDLSKSELGESATRLLGYLYLNRVWAGALRRTQRDVPFTVVVDEAQSLISGALSTMLPRAASSDCRWCWPISTSTSLTTTCGQQSRATWRPRSPFEPRSPTHRPWRCDSAGSSTRRPSRLCPTSLL